MGVAESLSSPDLPPKGARAHPAGYEPGVRYEPTEVTVQSVEPPGPEETAWRTAIERYTSLKLRDDQRVELTDVRYWGDPQSPMIYARYKITEPDRAPLDVNELVAAVQARPEIAPPASGQDRALIVAWADLQVGKVGSRGGTEELIERVEQRLRSVASYARELGAGSCYLIDVGDCVESFENVDSQSFTNDLSFPDQLRVARRLFTDAAARLAELHPRLVCAAVPSNHAQWRRGKGVLGKPRDDFGLETLTAVADAFKLAGRFGNTSFFVPDTWDETIAFDIHGQVLAVAHGHQAASPDRIPTWWAGQAHGGQVAADADILLTGHFHHLRVQPSGRSRTRDKSKWWIQAPTLDNGSDWYRLRSGSDSDPGLLTFLVGPDGWSDLRIH